VPSSSTPTRCDTASGRSREAIGYDLADPHDALTAASRPALGSLPRRPEVGPVSRRGDPDSRSVCGKPPKQSRKFVLRSARHKSRRMRHSGGVFASSALDRAPRPQASSPRGSSCPACATCWARSRGRPGRPLIAHGTTSDEDTIKDTAVAQPLIVGAGLPPCAPVRQAAPAASDGAGSGAIAGHSVGEITAAAGNGVLSAEQARDGPSSRCAVARWPQPAPSPRPA
jgi:hypothetical protein